MMAMGVFLTLVGSRLAKVQHQPAALTALAATCVAGEMARGTRAPNLSTAASS